MGEEKREEARRIVEEAGFLGGVEVEVRPSGPEGGGERRSVNDVEALREVLKAVSDFLRDLREPLEKLFNTLLSAMDGSRLGEDVASFYRKLRESGVPEDMAAEMTREYFRARLESFNIMGLLSRALRGELGESEREE